MSPLAAASASGESCTGGGGPSRGHSPPTSQASRSQLPRLGGGGFFRLSVSRVQLFYLGAVLTRPRLADAKMQPLHDSVLIRDRGRDLGGVSSCSQGHLCSAGQEPVLQAASLVAQEGLCPSEAGACGSLGTEKKTRVLKVVERGKGWTGEEGSVIHFDVSHFLGSNFLWLSAGK